MLGKDEEKISVRKSIYVKNYDSSSGDVVLDAALDLKQSEV